MYDVKRRTNGGPAHTPAAPTRAWVAPKSPDNDARDTREQMSSQPPVLQSRCEYVRAGDGTAAVVHRVGSKQQSDENLYLNRREHQPVIYSFVRAVHGWLEVEATRKS